jgi:hypothetical protein
MKIIRVDLMALQFEAEHAEKVAAAERQKQQIKEFLAGPKAAAIRAKHRAKYLEEKRKAKAAGGDKQHGAKTIAGKAIVGDE